MPLTITSTFSPMTYDELARPLVEQTNLHMQLEDQYSAINDKAAAMEAKANEQTDPIAYQQLKAYSESLKLQADQLMKVGLQRTSRQSLLDMKRRYNKEVLPVEEAYTRRAALAEEQRKLALQNPDMLFERQASNMSLDAFLANPQADYGAAYNGAMITKRVAEAVQAAAQGITSIRTDGHLTPYQIKVLKTHGFNPNEIERTIKGGGDANALLQSIRDRVLDTIDVYHKGDNNTKEKALGYANEGLRFGTGKSDYDLIKDEGALAALNWEYQKKAMDHQHALDIAKMNHQHQLAQQDQLQAQMDAAGAAINPQNIYSQEEMDEATKLYNAYKDYFDLNEDGTYTLNAKGIAEYNRINKDKVLTGNPYGGFVYETIESRSAFYDTLNKTFGNEADQRILGTVDGREVAVDAVSGAARSSIPSRGDRDKRIMAVAGEYFGNIAKVANPTLYDATKLTEYSYAIQPSEQIVWYQRVVEKAAETADGKVYSANWNSQTHTWDRGSSKDIKKAFANEGKVSSVQYSPYGITMRITDNQGNSSRYLLPAGINPSNEANLLSQLRGVQAAQELYRSMGTASTIPTPKNIKDGCAALGISYPETITKADLQQLVKQMESMAAVYMSQFGVTNSTKPQEFGTFGF